MKIWRDIADYLKFPYSTPTKPTGTASTNMFQEVITDSDRKEMTKRNPAGRCIVVDVAQDAVMGFTCLKPTGNEQPKFNAEVQQLFKKYIEEPLARALLQTRLYGYCGILIGYNTKDKLETAAKPNTKIGYLQPIPKTWVTEVALKKDKEGNTDLPLELDYYTLAANKKIDGTKLIHLENKGIDEDSIDGESSLDCVYDDLTILKSMGWGTGQSMWRGGGGLNVFVAPDGSTQEQLDGIHDVAEEINAKTVLTMPPGTGMLTARSININPKPSYTVILEQVSLGTRIPVSILIGAQAGTLSASAKDREDYNELLDNIQKNTLTPALTAILHKFQASGQLQEKKFILKWDRSPTWQTEEAKSKLYIAQTELQTNIAREKLAQAKRAELEYRERREELKAKKTEKDAPEEQIAQLPGIILEAPHAELIWRGIQKSIAKPIQLKHINEPAYLLADRKAYGIIRITHAAKVTAEQFKAATPMHLVTDEERKKQWQDSEELYMHSFTMDRMFAEPKACEYVQSRNHAKYVEFK